MARSFLISIPIFDTKTYPTAGIFRRTRVSFFGERLVFVGSNSVFPYTDKPRPFCLKKTCVQFCSCSLQDEKNETLAGQKYARYT